MTARCIMAMTEPVTRRGIRRLMFFMLAIVILVLTGLYFAIFHFFANKAAAYAVITGELAALSLIPTWSAKIAKLRKIERAQRLAAYKASPESHLLHLND
jgi:hypothetical protein